MFKLILFTNEKCIHCKTIKAMLNELKKEIDFELTEVDTGKDLVTALQYNIATVPSLVIIDGCSMPHIVTRGEVPDKGFLLQRIKEAVVC